MVNLAVTFFLVLFADHYASAATIEKLNEEKKTVVLKYETDEIPKCCKPTDQLKIENDTGEIGTYKVVALRKKKKRVTIEVNADLSKFEQDDSVVVTVVRAAPTGTDGDTTKDPKTQDTEEEVATTAPSGTRLRSEVIREKKNFGLMLGGGMIVGSIAGPSLDVYFNLGPKVQLGVTYGTGSMSTDLSDIDFVSKGEILASIISTRTRFFIWNNFNASLLLGMRTIDYNFTISARSSVNTVDAEVKTQSVIAGITLGNHWSFESGFTIGCDWFGYLIPVSSKSDSAVQTTGDVSAEQEDFAETVESSGKDLGSTSSDQALIFSVGWAF